MTVTLELKPEVEEKLVAEAKARGVSVETYILKVLEKEATNGEASFALTATPEEWKKHSLNGYIPSVLLTHRYQMKP